MVVVAWLLFRFVVVSSVVVFVSCCFVPFYTFSSCLVRAYFRLLFPFGLVPFFLVPLVVACWLLLVVFCPLLFVSCAFVRCVRSLFGRLLLFVVVVCSCFHVFMFVCLFVCLVGWLFVCFC